MTTVDLGTPEQGLQKMTRHLKKECADLDHLLYANSELLMKLENHEDFDLDMAIKQREAITRKLRVIEEGLKRLLEVHRNSGEKRERVFDLAHEIAGKAGQLIQSFRRLTDAIRDNQEFYEKEIKKLENRRKPKNGRLDTLS